MALTDKLKAIADAIRGKTGKTESMTLDEMPGEIAGIETGGGGEMFFTPYGVGYTPEMTVESTIIVGGSWNGANALKSINLPNWNPTGAAALNAIGIVTDTFASASLETLSLPKVQYTGHYWARDAKKLKTVQLGSVGYPATSLAVYTFYRDTQADLTISVYVDANTIADILESVTSSAPWGATNATIIYRNSTTGEVITE